MSARRWFHVLLGAVFVPVVSLPLVWGVAIHWLRRATDVDARRWARRLLLLAAVDTVVVGVGAALFGGGSEQPETLSGPVAVQDPVVIGVMPDSSYAGPGVRVERVFEGGPAAAAGLQVGDVILRVADEATPDPEALRTVVRERQPGVTVSIEVTRGSSTSVLPITPELSSRIPRPTNVPSESPDRGRTCFPRPSAIELLPLAAVLAAIAVLAVLVARRAPASGAAGGVWWTGLALVSAAVAGYAVPAGACLLLGGSAPARAASTVWASPLALAATGLAGRRFVRNEPASPPTRTWASAVGMGSWYLITGAIRLAVLLLGVMQLARGMSINPVESVAQALGPTHAAGLLLLAVPVVLVAPVAEEVAFRGLLQPALGAWLRPAAAVGVTSVLFAAMHWYYGPRLLLVLLVAAVLGWARIASGGLRAPIVLHMLVNAVGFVPIAVRAIWAG